MATITPPFRGDTAGIPTQYEDIIVPSEVALITGHEPAVLLEDILVAASQTLAARTVVGLDADGHLVAATSTDEAAGALTFSGVGTAADTITIGSKTYTLRAAPTTVANEVKIGATATETAANLIAAINGGAGAGIAYGSLTTAHPDVVASAGSAGVVNVVAKVGGTAGNSIATTETGTSTSFGAATLTGGAAYGVTRPIGVLLVAVTTDASPTLKAAPVYRAGCFNPDALIWGASFGNDAEKFNAFRGAPTPTNIIIRRPKTASV